jgi:hypothetical protein
MAASINGYSEVAKYLVESGSKIDAKNMVF